MDIQKLQIYDVANNQLANIINNTDNKSVFLLVDFATKYALSGNIWHKYIAYFIASNVNTFSLQCEYRTIKSPSLRQLALLDIEIISNLYNNMSKSIKNFDSNLSDLITNFDCGKCISQNSIVTNNINELEQNLHFCESAENFYQIITNYYRTHGVGDIAMHKAFKVVVNEQTGTSQLSPITNTDGKRLSDIIGYDFQKQQLCDNTTAFIEGRPANNALLYGDGGTGKSSSIKAIVNEYFPLGLRIIEVYKHQFRYLMDIISQLKHRNYKFLIYLDDLSFEDFEIDYKYFKAIIEGGIEIKPDNILIYATSNRRHIIKENFSDRNDMVASDELHRSDNIQEKLSLSSRFGLSLFYCAPNQSQYLQIVNELARKLNLDIDKTTLERKALAWSMRNSGKSGRTAQQFINTLV